jgi:hypothetical protein
MYKLYKTSPSQIVPNHAMSVGVTPQVSFAFDPTNSDYQAYLAWLEKGNTPEPVDPLTWEQIRSQRDALLKDSDWSVFPDANPKPSKEAWLAYRQTLRDVPTTFKTPEEVVWPTKPK